MSASARTNPGPDHKPHVIGARLEVRGGQVVRHDAAGHADVRQRVIPAAQHRARPALLRAFFLFFSFPDPVLGPRVLGVRAPAWRFLLMQPAGNTRV